MLVESAAATHVGCVRAVNEDSYLTLSALAVVMDGMGGHACGEVASALAVDVFRSLDHRDPLVVEDVVDTVERANRAILDEAERHPERHGMGTTVTGLAMVDQAGSPHWLVFNVGDSRIYRVTAVGLVQLTVDHSEVAELVAAGRITNVEARVHPLRNVVTRSVGVLPPPVVDTWVIPVADDDCFLLCSDGLTTELTDEQIADVLVGQDSLADAADALVRRAVEAGGRDNVTAVLARSRPRQGSGAEGGSTTPRSELRKLGA